MPELNPGSCYLFFSFLFRSIEIHSGFKHSLKAVYKLRFLYSSPIKCQTLFPKANNFRTRILSDSLSCAFSKIHACICSMQWIPTSKFFITFMNGSVWFSIVSQHSSLLRQRLIKCKVLSLSSGNKRTN